LNRRQAYEALAEAWILVAGKERGAEKAQHTFVCEHFSATIDAVESQTMI